MNKRRNAIAAILVALCAACDEVRAIESGEYLVYVTNERSGDVSIIDGGTNETLATIAVGKRPRGIHCSPDGKHVYIALSGSPRMGPGVDQERAPADKSADGIGVMDAASRKMLAKLPGGSDPEQFALTKRRTSRRSIANEDRGTASIVDLATGPTDRAR